MDEVYSCTHKSAGYSEPDLTLKLKKDCFRGHYGKVVGRAVRPYSVGMQENSRFGWIISRTPHTKICSKCKNQMNQSFSSW